MSHPVVSVLALGLLLVSGAALEVSARRRDRAPAGQALGAAMRTTAGRVTVFAAWVWLGVHFLAR